MPVPLLVGSGCLLGSPGDAPPSPVPAPAATPAPVPPLRLVPIVTSGLQGPLSLTHVGDDRPAGDPPTRSQNREERLGTILRIDVGRGSP